MQSRAERERERERERGGGGGDAVAGATKEQDPETREVKIKRRKAAAPPENVKVKRMTQRAPAQRQRKGSASPLSQLPDPLTYKTPRGKGGKAGKRTPTTQRQTQTYLPSPGISPHHLHRKPETD